MQIHGNINLSEIAALCDIGNTITMHRKFEMHRLGKKASMPKRVFNVILYLYTAFFCVVVTVSAQPVKSIVDQSKIGTINGLYFKSIPTSKPSGAYINASDLVGIPSSFLVSDTATSIDPVWPKPSYTESQLALQMSAGGVRIPLQFKSLRSGSYFIRLVGRVNSGTVTRVRKPLFVHLRINDGPHEEWSDYRMRVNYDSNLQEVGRIFFNSLNTSNTLDAELYVGDGSQETLLLHRLEFYDALFDSPRQRYKVAVGSFTVAERNQDRSVAQDIASHPSSEVDPNGKAYGDYVEWRWLHTAYPYKGLSDVARIARDDVIWDALPPLNFMHNGSHGYTGVIPDGLTADQAIAQFGSWYLYYPSGHSYYFDWDNPILLKNDKYGLAYTLADYKAHRSLGAPYPWGDDGSGYYYPSSQFSSPGMYYFIVGPLYLQRLLRYLGAISATTSTGGQDLSRRYHLTGDTDVAWDASLALVRFALQWPSMHMEAQDLSQNSANPDLVYNTNWRWEGRRIGKFYYDGWSGANAETLATAYDRLFDFIDGNTAFANAVHRYIPAIQTPADLIAFLDTRIIQSSASEITLGRIRGASLPFFGLVQNPSAYADRLMDLNQAVTDIYPLGLNPYVLHARTTITRDGVPYIGSTFYARGESDALVNGGLAIKRYQALDTRATTFQPKFDLTNNSDFPKLKAYADFQINSWIAGGYRPAVGDVGGAIYAPRAGLEQDVRDRLWPVWQYNKHPSIAWLLANVVGRSVQSDGQWAEVTAVAANARDPRLYSNSRVLGGFGVSILESGTELADYRKKSALVLRTGTGVGHAHNDALDLNYFNMGLRMANDFAQRNEGNLFTLPPDNTSYTHNTVEVDGYLHPWKAVNDWPPGSFSQYDSWPAIFKPGVGVQYVSADGASAVHSNVTVYRRGSALIDFDEEYANGEVSEPQGYIFDVFRVQGGKWHTWSFHGADTSGESDGFVVSPPLSTASDATTLSYLRKHGDGTRFEGVANAKVEATWRLGRTSNNFPNLCNGDSTCLNVTTVAAEQSMLGASYDSAKGRKYTKVTVFGRANDVMMSGNLFSAAYKMNQPILYLQARQPVSTYAAMNELSNSYPALIESYEGTPFITSSRALTVSPSRIGAQETRALEAVTRFGRVDELISAQDTATTFSVAETGSQLRGKFGMLSSKDGEIRSAAIVAGRELSRGSLSIKPDLDYYRATIKSVDYRALTLVTNERISAGLLDGAEMHIISGAHHSSFKALSINDFGQGSIVSLEKTPLLAELGVISASGARVTTNVTMVLSDVANRKSGLYATNESGSRSFRIFAINGTQIDFVPGTAVNMSDFTDVDQDGSSSLRIYDFGAGDTLEIATKVQIKKKTSTSYILRSDVPCEISLTGGSRMYLKDSAGLLVSEITTGTFPGGVKGRVEASALTKANLQVHISSQLAPQAPQKLSVVGP